MIKIKKGIDLPIDGAPTSEIDQGAKITHVGIVADDYKGMRPTMLVRLGDKVKIGGPLFSNKKNSGVVFTSLGSGEVVEINRGDRRAFQSLVIKLDDVEEHFSFKSYKGSDFNSYNSDDLEKLLVESGIWTSLRTRPFDKTPALNSRPNSVFITAMDTNPLSFDPEDVINEHLEDFKEGIKTLKNLTETTQYLCVKKDTSLNNLSDIAKISCFDGVHPAGNPGVHIHYLDPVGEKKTVWHINYHDVIMIGKLLKSGKLWTDKLVSIGGPRSKRPRRIKIRQGACLNKLLDNLEIEKSNKEVRVISGSVFNGTDAKGPFGFLGRFHHQITLLDEGNERELFGWACPGINKFSLINIYLSKLCLSKKFKLSACENGSHRAIVPIGTYERVMPGDFLATSLLKAICSGDIEDSINLGCLELAEEDLALATFVCPGKNDFSKILRNLLETIEKEG